MIGTVEIALIAAAGLLLFGGKKLPDIMRNMGRGVKEFKDGVQGASEQFQAGLNENELEKNKESVSDLEKDDEQEADNKSEINAQ